MVFRLAASFNLKTPENFNRDGVSGRCTRRVADSARTDRHGRRRRRALSV